MPRVKKAIAGVRKYRGKGDYTLENGPFANVGSILGRKLGGVLGSERVGEYIGRRALHYPAKYFGYGAYKKKRVYKGRGDYTLENQSVMSPEIPRFSKSVNEDGTVISHREYIGDIITSSSANTFNIDSYNINPGDPKTFPWLSSVAQCSYQQYEFLGCIFEYVSTSANALNSTNTALGVITSCINYDSTDADFSSRMQMENTNWANSSKPSMNMSIPVECDRKQTTIPLLYVSQNGVLPSDADPKMYNLGKLFVATSGFQGTSVNIGSLYVSYRVKLVKPYMSRPIANANRVLRVRNSVSSAVPLGTAYSSVPAAECDSLGVSINTLGTILTIPKERLQNTQRYLVIFEWNHDSGATTTPTITWSSNINAGYGVFGSSGNNPSIYAPKPTATTVTGSCVVGFIEVTNDNSDATATLSGATFPANCTLNLSIWQVCGQPSNILGILA